LKAPLDGFPVTVSMCVNACAWIVIEELCLNKEKEDPVATIDCGSFNLQITTANAVYKTPGKVSDDTLLAIRSRKLIEVSCSVSWSSILLPLVPSLLTKMDSSTKE
jgi:hypothetical protein